MKPSHLEQVISLRHTLHQYPELSMQETETMKNPQDFYGIIRLLKYTKEKVGFML